MGRRSSKESRYDRMDQFQKRKYKRKNSPKGPNEKGWAEVLLANLQKKNPDES